MAKTSFGSPAPVVIKNDVQLARAIAAGQNGGVRPYEWYRYDEGDRDEKTLSVIQEDVALAKRVMASLVPNESKVP